MRSRHRRQKGRGRDPAVRRLGRTPENLVMGRRTLRELLTHAPGRILKVITAESRRDVHGERQALLDAVRAQGIELQVVPRDQLDTLCGSDSHQSFAALVRKRDAVGLREFIAAHREDAASLVVMLDSVFDPQNLGAVMRAAECFGADAVLWSRNRGSGVTPTVTKASVGASELLERIEVANLAEAMRRLKEADYWIVAADADPQAPALKDYDFAARTVIVMGSEGSGLRDLTRRNVDAVVRIPTPGRIGSLNVSQATAIMLYGFSLHRRLLDTPPERNAR